ncbi:MAG: arylsulfatase [Planctomycetota bacterium]
MSILLSLMLFRNAPVRLSHIQAITCCLFLFAMLVGFASPVHATERPNIVLIFGDDMGIDSVAAFNDELGLETPHLDALASQGMSFMDAHSTSGVCTPSRYSLLTGRYHWRSRLKRGIVGKWERPLIEEGRITIPGMLLECGYTTQMIGKWHLGHHWPKKGGGVTNKAASIDFAGSITGGPNAIGFENWFGDDVPNWPPYAWQHNDRLLGEITTTSKQLGLTDYVGVSDGPAVADWKLEAVLPEYAKRCSEYVRQQKDSTKPFFLYFPMPSPHTPIAPDAQWKGKSGISDYADFLLETDWAVGEILNALEETGQADETIVIFSTDNGTSPKANFEKLESDGVHLRHHWRGNKADAYEGGHRVPFIVRWPGRVPAGTKSHKIITQADVFATVAGIVGYDFSDEVAEDSVSLLSTLTGNDDGEPLHEAIVNHSIYGHFAVRSGDWKLLFCRGSGGWSHPRENVAEKQGLPPLQLYNLADDPKESKDVSAQHPEVVARLTKLLRRYVESGRSTPGKRVANFNGQLHWGHLPWEQETD